MKLIALIFVFLAFSYNLFGQQKMIVFLDEKSDQVIDQAQFSERSLARRAKRGIQFDVKDQAIKAEYIASLTVDGRILNKSRWLNAVSYTTALTAEELMMKYSFIKRVKEINDIPPRSIDKFAKAEKSLAYGPGFGQVNQLNLNCLHDLGFTGMGIYMAIIDAGFENMQQIEYFDTLFNETRVLDRRNFVTGGSQVYNASGHGTAVASCIVGEKGQPIEYAGAAVDVDIALYLTEDVSSETELEEFNLVAALERCDSVGVDVANISLGYVDFDDSLTNHVYADMDGNSTIAAIGVNVAVSKGIAVVMAAGNQGPSTISTPCDADDGLCVGAVDFLGDYAFFSSVGPSSDGDIKPNVVATGLDTWVVLASGDVEPGNGTSFASPIMAGATACLIQAHPTKSISEIFEAIEMSSSQYTTPDQFKGYGIPDMCLANDLLNAVVVNELPEESLRVYPNPSNDYIHIEFKSSSEVNQIALYSAIGELVLNSQGKEDIDVRDLNNGVYTIRVAGNNFVYHKQVVINH